MFRGARENETPPGIRFLGVARQYDRCLIASYRHDTSGSKIEEQQALVQKVLGSARATDNHPRLTVTDREHGSLHYDSDREYFYITSEYRAQCLCKTCVSWHVKLTLSRPAAQSPCPTTLSAAPSNVSASCVSASQAAWARRPTRRRATASRSRCRGSHPKPSPSTQQSPKDHCSPSPSPPVCALTCRRIGAGAAAHGRRVRAL